MNSNHQKLNIFEDRDKNKTKDKKSKWTEKLIRTPAAASDWRKQKLIIK